MKILRIICLLLILFLVFLQIKIEKLNTGYRDFEYMNMAKVLLTAKNIAETMEERIKIKEEEINNLKKEVKKSKTENLIIKKKYSELSLNKEKSTDENMDRDRLEDLRKGIKDVFSIVNQANPEDINRKKRKILKKVDDRIEQMKEEVFNFISEEEAYKNKLILKEKEIENFDKKVKEYTEEKQNMAELINEMKEEKDKYLSNIKDIKENNIKNNELINEFNKEKIKYQERVTELEDDAGELKEERDSFAENYRSLEEQNNGFVKENKGLKKNQAENSKVIIGKDEKIKLLENDISVWKEKYEKLNKEKDLADNNIAQMETLIARRADKILALQEEFEDKERLILEAGNKINVQLKEITLLRKDVIIAKLENTAFTEKIKRLNNQIKENFEKTLAILNPEQEKDIADSNKIQEQGQSLEHKEVTVEIMSAEITDSEIVK